MTSLAFKVKSKNGQQILKDLTSESTVGELKMFLSNISDVSPERICVLCGYPPKPLDISNDSKKINEIGLKTGESLIVEEKSAPTAENIKKTDVTKPVENGVSHETIGPCRPGILMKKVVPSDNSCLFTSIGFVLNGNVDTSVHTLMRQIIAMEVASDHDTYNEGVLGRPNAEYCAWIQQPSSWGGAIEVAILSRFYGLEMAVVDTLNAIINRFGEDKNYGQRVFLLFDGVHYDPLYLEQSDGGTQTVFPSEDLDIYREAEQLAHEAKSSRQFTDLNKFTLKCMICDKLLSGQAEAQRHAKETKHANFGEVAILSRFYGLEMAVVDTLNAIINRFGEDKNYGQRVFLLFDGVHYDPLYLEQSDVGTQTVFPSEDLDIYREAEQLAHEAKSSRQFTDLNKFTLKCMICDKLLSGQAEAQRHAKETKHANFGEVAILSRFYGLEMAVVDTLNAIINRFGEDKNYGQRVFLLFDGVHYDPLYLEQSDGGTQTVFPSEDLDIYREAEQLAHEAKSSRQFTDLNKFTLKCMICDKLLSGQAEAQRHAKETKHANFGEV